MLQNDAHPVGRRSFISGLLTICSLAAVSPLPAQNNGEDDEDYSWAERAGFAAVGVYGGASVGMLAGIGVANAVRLVDRNNEAYRPIGIGIAAAGLMAGGVIGGAEPDLLGDVAVRAAIGAGIGGVLGTVIGLTGERQWEWILAGIGTGIIAGQVAGVLLEDDDDEELEPPLNGIRRGIPVVLRLRF